VTTFTLELDNGQFIIQGDVDSIAQKNRFKSNFLSFGGVIESNNTMRLSFSTSLDDNLPNNEVQFTRIKKLFDKFNLVLVQSSDAAQFLDEINQEALAFKQFSQKALDIRNNRHDTDDFKNFIVAVNEAFPVRVPYRLQLLSAYHLAF